MQSRAEKCQVIMKLSGGLIFVGKNKKKKYCDLSELFASSGYSSEKFQADIESSDDDAKMRARNFLHAAREYYRAAENSKVCVQVMIWIEDSYHLFPIENFLGGG